MAHRKIMLIQLAEIFPQSSLDPWPKKKKSQLNIYCCQGYPNVPLFNFSLYSFISLKRKFQTQHLQTRILDRPFTELPNCLFSPSTHMRQFLHNMDKYWSIWSILTPIIWWLKCYLFKEIHIHIHMILFQICKKSLVNCNLFFFFFFFFFF